MNPARVVAEHHLKKSLHSRGFLFSLVALPLFLVLTIGLGILSEETSGEPPVLGVFDPGGIIRLTILPGVDEPPTLQVFNDLVLARMALKESQIQSLYILPPGYPADRQVELLFYDPPDWQTQEYFADILRLNLLAGFPEEITLRAIEEPQVSIHSLTSGRSFPAAGPNAGTLATLILAVIYMFALFPIAEILVGALGDEKANRTIEIVLTSIKPSQLMLGKIAAVIGMVLVEIVAWLLMVILAVWIGGTWFHVKWMQNVTIPWWDVLQFTLLAVSGLAFYCAAMVFVGSLLHEREEIRQAASLVILPVFLPLYVLPALLETPNGPIALAFALLPITSVQAQGIQLFLIPVSAWITISAIAINLASAGLCAWLASIAFRQASLRYGQAVKLGSLFGRPKVR